MSNPIYDSLFDELNTNVIEYIFESDREYSDFIEHYGRVPISHSNMIHIWAKSVLVMRGLGYDVDYPIEHNLDIELIKK